MALRIDVLLAMKLGLFAGTQLRRPLYESGNGGQSDEFKLWRIVVVRVWSIARKALGHN